MPLEPAAVAADEMRLKAILDWLDRHDIDYRRVDHPAVYTCEEADRLVPPLPGAHTKNLFVRDRRGRRHFLVVVGWEHQVDLKELGRILGVSKLGMASPERLWERLGVDPGAVTLLAVINDEEKVVEVVIDAQVWAAQDLQCHPLVNTSTLSIPRRGVEKLLQLLKQPYRIVDVPRRALAP